MMTIIQLQTKQLETLNKNVKLINDIKISLNLMRQIFHQKNNLKKKKITVPKIAGINFNNSCKNQIL